MYKASVTLDGTSTWVVSGDSYITSLLDNEGICAASISNIIGNGHTVYCDSSLPANSFLGGKTYSLNDSGYLTSSTSMNGQ